MKFRTDLGLTEEGATEISSKGSNAPKKLKYQPKKEEKKETSGKSEVKVRARRPCVNFADVAKSISLPIIPKSFPEQVLARLCSTAQALQAYV